MVLLKILPFKSLIFGHFKTALIKEKRDKKIRFGLIRKKKTKQSNLAAFSLYQKTATITNVALQLLQFDVNRHPVWSSKYK